MKVGTDSLLFGCWADCPSSARQALDVGTGTGILSLILAQRTTHTQITALEIEPEAASQAQENFTASPWSDRLEVITADFRSFTDAPSYDFILSNPPYFQNALLSPDQKRTTARHTSSLSYRELVQKVALLLSPEGVFSLILPAEYAALVRSTAFSYGLYTKRLAEVKTTVNGTCKRVMMEFSRHLQLCRTESIILRTEDGKPSSQFKELTKEMYHPDYTKD